MDKFVVSRETFDKRRGNSAKPLPHTESRRFSLIKLPAVCISLKFRAASFTRYFPRRAYGFMRFRTTGVTAGQQGDSATHLPPADTAIVRAFAAKSTHELFHVKHHDN